MPPMLAIDPAVRGPVGVAIVDPGHDYPVRYVNVIQFAGADWVTRLSPFAAALRYLIAQYAPVGVACEDSYLGQNAQSFKKLAHVAGFAHAIACVDDLPFLLVSTSQARVALTRDVAASNEHMIRACCRLFGATVFHAIPEREREHAASAIGVGWHAAGVLGLTLKITEAQTRH